MQGEQIKENNEMNRVNYNLVCRVHDVDKEYSYKIDEFENVLHAQVKGKQRWT